MHTETIIPGSIYVQIITFSIRPLGSERIQNHYVEPLFENECGIALDQHSLTMTGKEVIHLIRIKHVVIIINVSNSLTIFLKTGPWKTMVYKKNLNSDPS